MRTLCFAFALFCLSACTIGNLTAVHKRSKIAPKEQADVNSPYGVFIDAKQRAVVSNVIDSEEIIYQYDDQRKPIGSQIVQSSKRVVCAEPSPDALAAIAASTGVSFSDLTRAFSATNSVSEAAGNIGLRTQTIQTMRDGYYRVCEAYMNGLDQEQYAMMLRRFQTNTIALLAIEQLTGTVTGPDLALSSTAGVPISEKAFYEQRSARESSIKVAREEELNEIKAELTPLKTQKEACAAISEGDTTSDVCTEAKTKERDAMITQLEERETDLTKQRNDAQAERDRLAALATSASSATSPDATASASSVRFASSPTAAVADAVKDITLRVLNQDYGVSMCVDYLRSGRATNVANECRAIVQAYGRQIELNSEERLAETQNRQLALLHQQKIIDNQFAVQQRVLEARLTNIESIRKTILADGKISSTETKILDMILGADPLENLSQISPNQPSDTTLLGASGSTQIREPVTVKQADQDQTSKQTVQIKRESPEKVSIWQNLTSITRGGDDTEGTASRDLPE